MSTLPRASDGIWTTFKPVMPDEAGLVPWAESGISILTRLASPRDL